MSALQHTSDYLSQTQLHAQLDELPDASAVAFIEPQFRRADDKAILENQADNCHLINDWAKQQTFQAHQNDTIKTMGYFPAQSSGDFEKLDALDSELAEKFLFLDIFVQRLQDSPNARRWKMIASKITRQSAEILIRYSDGTRVKIMKNTATGKSTAIIQSKLIQRLSVDLDTLITAI